MVTRAEVIAEAKEWIDTPFHHQASVKGVGTDCGGLVRGVYNRLGVETPNCPVDYARTPSNDRLRQIILNYAVRTSTPKPGDIILFVLLKEPQHVGILTDRNTVIHAYEPNRKVIEHRLDDKWKRRIESYYTYPEIVD
jgi:NlpC/P60 family putative phage cell wall peptidase